SSSFRFTLLPSQGSLSMRASRGGLAQISLDGFDDVLISGAPAEIASQLLAQRRALEGDAVIGQRDGGEQEPRRAVPALEGVRIAKCLLHGVQLAPPRETLNGRDRPAVRLGRQHQARLHRLAVEQYRARTTDTLLASDVSPVKLELVAQEVDQQATALDLPFVCAAVDPKRDARLRDADETACGSREARQGSAAARPSAGCLRA